MKKSLLLFFVACFTLWGGDGYCRTKGWVLEEIDKGCIINDTKASEPDVFYFCVGSKLADEKKIAGVKFNRGDEQKTVQLGEEVHGYYCCDVDGTRKFIASKAGTKKGEATSADKKRTCKYDIVYDVCGKEVSTPCNPECPDGQVSHPFSGECVAPCPDGKVFESEMSTRCIECPITAHSGVVRVMDENGQYLGSYCKTCNGTSQIFDSRNPVEKYVGAKTLKEKAEYSAKNNPFLRRTGDITESKYTELCVDITNLPVLATKNQMSECALCPGDLFEKCVKCIDNGCNSDTDLRKKCRLK
ncbi:MAG: hypothetical protein ACLRFI_01200 [Alphaproteobacteria bacterium]